MSPRPVQKRGSPLTATPATATEVEPTSWASDDSTSQLPTQSAVIDETTYVVSYVPFTTDGVQGSILSIAPLATAGASTSSSSGASSSKLALAIALPITLFAACSLILALYLCRFRARQSIRRRRAQWARRLTWVPDTKETVAFEDDPAKTTTDFNAPTPMSPISPVPPSYSTHQRKDSTFA